jgi:catechol 2,3-dioxygenase-like lactoylglutathione lyase family enzyme
MIPALPGIHHVTAITADAQQNIDFYSGVLGLRLVKLPVNFDDPESYHRVAARPEGVRHVAAGASPPCSTRLPIPRPEGP